MMTPERRAEIEGFLHGIHPVSVRNLINELLAEIDHQKLMAQMTEREYESYERIAERVDAAAHDHAKIVGRHYDEATNFGEAAWDLPEELERLRGEIVGLKESAVSRSELAATTIAGLEGENARLRAALHHREGKAGSG